MELPNQLTRILEKTSRSFYLSITILPRAMRLPVAVAYLIARAADSIADLDIFCSIDRSKLLQYLRDQLSYVTSEDFSPIVEIARGERFEIQLLRELPSIFEILRELEVDDRADVQHVVGTLIEGMLFDLNFFANANSEHPVALQNDAQLDRYTYLIAGCVGEFWTRLLFRHIRSVKNIEAEMEHDGIELGKALQLTNILRDQRADRAIGRIYLPESRPEPEYWISQAIEKFEAAENYLHAIPRRYIRLRLAVFWPAIIGLKTLAMLHRHPKWWTENTVCKIRRGEVYRIMLKSVFIIVSNNLTTKMLRRARP